MARDDRTPILYLAPWVDIGGSDKATVDWFRWIDRERFAPSLITTQPSPNRWLDEIRPYATEVWALPDLLPGTWFPRFIFEFIASRRIELVHIMNSRIAFDLLPDVVSMRDRPATVVQLHVEEEDRSGYVRYVTTRYDNLIDVYSVTSHQLSAAMADYQVPAVKRRVIHTGVDADYEYNRALIAPADLAEDRFHVVFPARLVEQKDPLLMLDVAAAVVAAHPHALFHVLGDGPLEPALRARSAALGLDDHVRFHGAQTDPRPWYAAAHALLMTSTFEGIPCTVFETMAMGLPVVAPALPGVVELLADSGTAPIGPRDDVAAYARALGALAGDESHRRAVAERAREHVRERFGVDRMARAHEALYDELLASREARIATNHVNAPADDDAEEADDDELVTSPVDRIALLTRPTSGQPLVSIVVPCFNHGLFLPACLHSIRMQDYPAIEVVVVDDGSTDPMTVSVIDGLESEGWARVIRQPVNGGPSRARNAALDIVRGRYVLPVDADNLLIPDAVARLVAQLQAANETVGFIYPNSQYFGNRNDYFEAPAYNLYALLRSNYCDTCSLFDRAVFDEGIRFAEDITLGHEDWDLMLQLAGRGVRGEPARGKTQLYRKHGFTRSDSVEYAQVAFAKEIRRRHPTVCRDPAIKPRECPGLSIVVLDELECDGPLSTLAERLGRQSFLDLELIARFDGRWPRTREPRCVRRIPPAEADGAAEMLALGLQLARSPTVLTVSHGLSSLLADRALLEQIARMGGARWNMDAIAFVDAGASANPLAAVAAPDELTTEPHAALLLRRRAGDWPRSVDVVAGEEIGGLLAPLVAARDRVHWCHLPSAVRTPRVTSGARRVHYLSTRAPRVAEEPVVQMQADEPMQMPGRTVPSPRRWSHQLHWMPPETVPLVRHVNHRTGCRVVSASESPPGFEVERVLGALQQASPPGTARLECVGAWTYRAVDRSAPREQDPAIAVLGHVELVALPLLSPLLRGTLRATGQEVLLNDDDPLLAESDVHDAVGFIEGYPIHPRDVPNSHKSDYGLRGLLRTIDRARRRHVYATGEPPSDCELVGELGALLSAPGHETIALEVLPCGLVGTADYRPPAPVPTPTDVARWTLAPATWRDIGRGWGRARAVARRATDAPRMLQRSGASQRSDRSELLGYLFTQSAPGRCPLWAGVHPITGDQLLSRHEFEPNDMGYRDITLLGFVRDRAPITGTLEIRQAGIPWASRFGLKVRPA